MKAEVYAPGSGLHHGPLIGHLVTPDLRKHGGRSYELCLDEPSEDIGFEPFGAPMVNRRWCALRIERRGVRVNEHDIASMHWRSQHDIPDYAEEAKDIQHLQRIFSWPVLVAPDKAIAEAVFDLDIFEPTGRQDSSASADRYWWETYEGRRPELHSGGLVSRKMMVGRDLTSALTATAISADKLSSGLKNLSFNIEQMKSPEQTEAVRKAVEAAAKGLRKSFESEVVRRLLAGF